jgi:peptidoglycan/xylan/chitin deacetylase (PgdA/CDA1 family)
MQNAVHSASSGANGFKAGVKATLGWAAFTGGLHRRVLRDRAVVIAFHRIYEGRGEALNCPPRVFAALCRFFKRHFSVIPLSELVLRVRENRPIGGVLSITFDDGYKDNFEVAAPILRNLDLPATFFVATNFIDSASVPFWDERDGVESKWMSWADVRELAAMGFDIGGHTMNHADLGLAGSEQALAEIAGCRDALLAQLGGPVRNFAYPFGGERNITPGTRQLVADAGFECCLSCHGGVILATDDVFELRREPINTWIRSPYQYGFELLQRAAGVTGRAL